MSCVKRPWLCLVLVAELGTVSHPGGIVFGVMKGSQRAPEAWHFVAVRESLRSVQERPLVKVQPNCRKRSCILEMQVPWVNHQEQQWWSGACLNSEHKLCVLLRAELEN